MFTTTSREKESCLSDFALNLSQMPRAKAVISKKLMGRKSASFQKCSICLAFSGKHVGGVRNKQCEASSNPWMDILYWK